MAETIQIDPELLYPGDTIRFDFVVKSGNQTLVDMATKKIKETIYSDDRLDYQGSEAVSDVDKTGLEGGVKEIQVLRIYATVRKYRRNAPPELQKAGIGPFAAVTLVALITTAIVAYSGALVYVSATTARSAAAQIAEVEKIRTDPNLTNEEKVAMANAVGEATKTQGGIGAGIAAFGGSLVTAAIIIGVLWALSLSGHSRRSD